MRVLFLVSAPGAGKTTAVRVLLGMTGSELPLGSHLVPKPKWTVTERIVAAGHYVGGTFDGADTVPYNGVQAALAYWQENFQEKPLTVFDGDRFSIRPALDFFLTKTTLKPFVVELKVEEALLVARRQERGSNQNPIWLKGRVTKAANFGTGVAGVRCAKVDANLMTPAEVARFLLDVTGCPW